MSNIIADNLTKTYGRGNAAVNALGGVSFTIESGEFIAIMGESGAGKSTLLSILGAMNSPTEGILQVDGIPVYDLDSDRQADFRREFLGFIFQSFHLVPYLTVLENVILPLSIVRRGKKDKARMAMAALEQVNLEDKAGRLPGEISGGEKERAAIARAIVNDPPILLADEPTGNLDSRNSQGVMNLLNTLHAGGMTIVMVTHSLECAEAAQRVMTVEDGALVC